MPIEKAPARNGDLPVLDAGEELKFSEPQTKLFEKQNLIGEGVLHLTTRRIVWLHSQNPGLGLAMDYPFVTLHAVSTDKAAWPEPCLYCQLKSEEADGSCDEEEEPDIPELRFQPADSGHLQNMYTAFSEMSALNPDPTDEQANTSDSDLEDEGDDDIGMQTGAPPPGALTCNGAGFWSADRNTDAMEDASEEESELEAEGDVSMDTDMK